MSKLLAALLLIGSSSAMAYDSYMGEIIGGVAGGIIGNQIGGGSGRTAATAIGAGIGAVVGGRVEDSMNYNRYGYNNNYNRYSILPQSGYVQPPPYYQSRVIVVPANTPTPLGYRCELQSVYVNGQVVTNNYCY